MREIVRLQAEWSAGALSTQPSSVAPLGRSEWVAVNPLTGLVERFSAAGSYVAPLARKGHGPGEIAGATLAVRWLADSLLVFDASQGRLLVFDASGRFQRGMPWTGKAPLQLLVLADGGFIAPITAGTRQAFGIPFHQFSASGEWLRSFGARTDQKIVSREELPVYRIDPRARADGSFWTVEARTPTLRKWNTSGDRLDEWALPMTGFAPLVSTRPEGPAGAEFMAIEQAGDGLLFVALAVRAANYLEAYGEEKASDGRRGRPVEDHGKYFDTLLLVLDPVRRSVVTMTRIDAVLLGALGEGRFWGIAPGVDGGRTVVVQLTLNR